MENAQIAGLFDEIADLLELQGGNAFRIRSYRNAARTVRDLAERLADMVERKADLTALPNIGESTAEKIQEIVRSGTCGRLEELRGQVPQGLVEVMKVPGLGPKKAMALHEELKIDSLDRLRQACRKHQVAKLKGMGEKTEQNILKGLETLQVSAGRLLLKEAGDHVRSLERHLGSCEAVQRWEVAGSFRRRKETIGDLDVLVHADRRDAATEQILKYDAITEAVSRGEQRLTVLLAGGLQVDFRFFEPKSFGAAWMYFTGSKAHNIALRRRAQERGWKLNEYGLSQGRKLLAGRDEKEVYRKLGLPWIAPELREDRGEIEAAARNQLPSLLELDDIRGDLQTHTTATDGSASLEEMAEAARKKGYAYLAITDHSQAVRVANGMDETRTRKQAEKIRKLSGSLKDLWLLAGVEVDILKDGRLDLDEKVLAELDWVVAAVHSYWNLSPQDATDRLLRAIRSGVVHAIGHPTGRMIGQRDPIAFDFEKVFAAAVEEDVCLEVNAQPERLDLPDHLVKQAVEAGATFTLGTDAHKLGDLDFMPLAVAVARRGWVGKKNVLNTLTAAQLRKRIQR